MTDHKEEYYLKRNAELTKMLLRIKKMISDLNLESGWDAEKNPDE